MNYWIAPSFYFKTISESDKKQKDESVINKVCEYYGINLEDLRSGIRKRKYVMARQVISYIFREVFEYGFEHIGTFINKDHSTVVYNVKNVAGLSEFDNKFKVELNRLVNYAKFYTPAVKEEKLIKGKTSLYKGVCIHTDGKWRATIRTEEGKYKHLGLFKNELDAFNAYTKAKNKQLNK